MMCNKTSGRLSIVLLFGVVAFLIKPNWQSENIAKIPSTLGKRCKTLSKGKLIKIAGRSFQIPVSYIEGSLEGKKMEGKITLNFVLPHFDYLSRYSSKQIDEINSEGFYSNLLLTQANIWPSIESIFQAKKENLLREARIDNLDALEAFKWNYPGTGEKIVYIKRNKNGEVTRLIECNEGQALPQTCSDLFIDKSIFYELRYDRKRYLHSWESVGISAIKFVDSYEIITDQ